MSNEENKMENQEPVIITFNGRFSLILLKKRIT